MCALALVEETTDDVLTVAIRQLRGVDTIEQLVDRIPQALRLCGFSTSWVSRLSRSAWSLAGSADLPHPLVPGSHEAEMARRRAPVLVEDATDDRRVDPVVRDRFAPESYVAAPLVVDAKVIGFVHATVARRSADADDLRLLGLFTEITGHVLERVVLQGRLQAMRRDVRALTATIDDTVDDRCWASVDLADAPVDQATRAPDPVPPKASRITSLLTAREVEVLKLMAMGETNPGIARELVISEGTVKSHVKHILRKLHATNRAQAVSRYLRIAHA